MEQLNTDAHDMLFFQTKKQQRRTIPVDIKPVVVHFNPIYEQFDNHQRVHNQIVQDANCVRIRVKIWPEFINAIREEQPDFLTIHQSVIDLEHHTLKEFSATIQSLVTYLPKHRRHNELLPVAIGIEQDTTQNFVQQLKRAGFAGIWPTGTTFGVDGCVAAMKVFLADREYWPADIINQLPNPSKKPLSIYFREDWFTYITPEWLAKFNEKNSFDVSYCANLSALDQALKQQPHQLIFHISMLEKLGVGIPEFISMLDTRLKLAGLNIPVAVGFEPTTPLSTIKELKRAGVFSVVPSAAQWGIDETIKAIESLAERKAHWPRHIIDQLPSDRPPPVVKNTNGIKLTVRQQEVMDLICHRGLSNKQIAKTLSLSESTVKIHVSAVMKSYGVRNRTQLALSAGTGLKA